MHENDKETISIMYDIASQQQEYLQDIISNFDKNVDSLKDIKNVVGETATSIIKNKLEDEIEEAEDQVKDIIKAAKDANNKVDQLKNYTNKRNFLFLISMCFLVVLLGFGLIQYEIYRTKILISQQDELKHNINMLKEQGGEVKLIRNDSKIYVRVNYDSCVDSTDGDTYCLPK